MCATCGCGDAAGPRIDRQPHPHATHPRAPARPRARHATTDRTAAPSRHARAEGAGQERPARRGATATGWPARGIVAVNLMSSPGSGKTTLLERTIRDLGRQPAGRGDRGRSGDAARRRPHPRATGCAVVQVNTGAGCHLDAAMVRDALTALDPPRRLGAVRRERRQPGLPGAVRPGRGRQGRDHLGDRGDRQAAEVPAHVRGRRTWSWSTRSTCCRTSTSTSTLCRGTRRRSTRGAEVLALSATSGDNVDAWYDWLAAVRSAH